MYDHFPHIERGNDLVSQGENRARLAHWIMAYAAEDKQHHAVSEDTSIITGNTSIPVHEAAQRTPKCCLAQTPISTIQSSTISTPL